MKTLSEDLPPKPRTPKPRLTKKARQLVPKGSTDDPKNSYVDVQSEVEAICVRSHGRGKGWKMVQAKGEIDGVSVIRVWRLK